MGDVILAGRQGGRMGADVRAGREGRSMGDVVLVVFFVLR